MADSIEPLAEMLEAFLSTRDRRSNGRGVVAFNHVSVEGSGKGVGRPDHPAPVQIAFFSLTHRSRYRFKRLLQFKLQPSRCSIF